MSQTLPGTSEQRILLPDYLRQKNEQQLLYVEEAAKANHPVYPTFIPDIDRWMHGGIPPGSMVLIPARASFGKSALLQLLAKGLLRNKDVVLLWFTLDDNVPTQLRRLIASLAAVPEYTVRQAHLRKEQVIEDKIKKATDVVRAMQARMSMFGAADTPGGLATISEIIRETYTYVSTSTGQRPQIILFIDSTRNLDVSHVATLFGSGYSITEYIGRQTKALLDIEVGGTRIEPIIITTDHLRKLPREIRRPGLDDIKDSIGPQYDANVVLMLWNDLAYSHSITHKDTGLYFERTDMPAGPDGLAPTDPIVEVSVAKTKVGRTPFGSGATALFKLYQEQTRLEPITDREEYERYLSMVNSG